jgi:hypothetical protein
LDGYLLAGLLSCQDSDGRAFDISGSITLMHAYLVRDGHAKFVSYVACLFDKDRPEPPMKGTGMALNTFCPYCMPVFVTRRTP